eukprot:1188992-Prorocentrum_minimum.AAC.2
MWGFPTAATELVKDLLKGIHEDVLPEEPLPQSDMIKLLKQTPTKDSTWIFFDNEEYLHSLLQRLVITLNSKSSLAHKTDALFLVSKLARGANDPAPVLEALQVIVSIEHIEMAFLQLLVLSPKKLLSTASAWERPAIPKPTSS